MKTLIATATFLYRHIFVLACWVIWLDIEMVPDVIILDPARGLGNLTADLVYLFTAMLGCVFSVVRYADRVAEFLGEPLGTLVLTLSVTTIEVTLMLTVMTTGSDNPTLLRDTVFATLMIVLNGMVGLTLTAGGWRHREQSFNLRGALSFLHLITPLSLIILVVPNYTRSSPGSTLAPIQEAFLGALCASVYMLFLLMQSTRHRTLFDHVGEAEDLSPVLHPDEEPYGDTNRPHGGSTTPRMLSILAATAGLLVSLAPIVLLAEHLGSLINYGIEYLTAPTAVGGILVTALVLTPEGLGALKAALGNRMQRAVNICLGSALSTMAMTVPAVLIAAGFHRHAVILGIDPVERMLLYATLFTVLITFVSGRSTLLQGSVHLTLFITYLFFIFFP